MKHLFKATRLGWERQQDGIWFDADDFTEEEARSQFCSYEGTTQRGYSYTGYEYNGVKYHDITYLGQFEDDELPKNDLEYMDILIRRSKNKED